VTGTIKGNRVSDALTTAPHPLPGVGIVTFFTHEVEVTGNVVENVNVGSAANLAFASRITKNRINGQQTGIGSTGLILSGSDTAVSENHFKKLDLGVLLMIDDPMFGSAFNTSLHKNEFEHVGLDLLTGSAPAAMMALSVAPLEAQPDQVQRKFGPR
jgi:nitrous oxidase accessory protein NosD